MTKAKVAAIVQARMGSSRLPEKILMPIAGKPVLWHVIHRLRKCKTLDVIAIATSENETDDPLVGFARKNNVLLIRGSENNVLQRYAKAVEQIDPDVIIRVTGDAPLVDAEIIDKQVQTLLKENADKCGGDPNTPTIHEGFSTISRKAFDRLLLEASDDPVAMEHVTAYIKQHPETFKHARIKIPEAHHFKGARMSVDTPADLQFMNELYKRLGSEPGEANMADVVKILIEQPDLLEINAHIYQKKASDKSFNILFRCDGDNQVGLGHIVRCLALANELREKHGCGVTFALANGIEGRALIEKEGFPVEMKPDKQTEGEWMDRLIGKKQPNALVLDVRTDLPVAFVRKWREAGVLIVSIDDPSDRRLEADLAFYPPVPQVKEMDWTGFTGKLYSGWEWVLLRPQFSNIPKRPQKKPGAKPVILVSMGGSDPAGLTLKTLTALEQTDKPFNAIVVLGPAFKDNEKVSHFLKTTRHTYQIERNVDDMMSLMLKADLAIVSFGVTAYELAACGVPALYICLTEDHARSASVFERSRLGITIGLSDNVSINNITTNIKKYFNKSFILTKGNGQIKYFGSEKVAHKIVLVLRGQGLC